MSGWAVIATCAPYALYIPAVSVAGRAVLVVQSFRHGLLLPLPAPPVPSASAVRTPSTPFDPDNTRREHMMAHTPPMPATR
ncbi:hypothetical protein B0H14DRAFT_3444914 [Mycena olivaceomarginata]|nr:hypothetical protein B0H14DRAFT_3444914 [Mycena olivaceomarginata]